MFRELETPGGRKKRHKEERGSHRTETGVKACSYPSVQPGQLSRALTQAKARVATLAALCPT